MATNASGLPGIPFKYHPAYDVRYRNAAISMDSDDMSFLNGDEEEDYGNEEYSERSNYTTTGEEDYGYKRLQKQSHESIGLPESPKFSNEEYSERSTYLSNYSISGEGYNYKRLQMQSHESFGLPRSPRFRNEEYSERSTHLSTSGEGYSYKRLQKQSHESFGLPRSPKLGNEEYSGRSSYKRLQKPSHESIGLPKSPKLNAYGNGLVSPRSDKGYPLSPQSNKAPQGEEYQLSSPTLSNKSGLLTPQKEEYQLPSPTPSAEEDTTIPSIPTKTQHSSLKLQPEYSSSSNKKQKRYFSLGKSFTSLVSNTLKLSNKKSVNSLNYDQDKPQITTPTIPEVVSSETLLPTLIPSSPISHQLPENYFPEGFDKNEKEQPKVTTSASGLTVDELYSLILNMQKRFRQLTNEIDELRLEIRKLKGEEGGVEDNEGQNGRELKSVKSFTRQMERQGGEGRWFHNG